MRAMGKMLQYADSFCLRLPSWQSCQALLTASKCCCSWSLQPVPFGSEEFWKAGEQSNSTCELRIASRCSYGASGELSPEDCAPERSPAFDCSVSAGSS